jgi:hypothetical protein
MTARAVRSLSRRDVAALAVPAAVIAGTMLAVVIRVEPAGNPPIALARAAALVEATTGAGSEAVRAVGQDARLINAAMPYSAAPVLPARAFVLPASGDLDHRRALLCLTQAVYYEAGYEPLTGRRAVAQVVLNRTRHPAFPKSVCGVVYQRNSTPVCQFSFVCDGSLDRRPSPGAWRQAEAIAREALSGRVEGSVGASTFYHADYVAPRWAPMLAKTSKIGAHIFYRWPGAWGQPAAFTGRYIGEPRDPSTMRPAIARTILDEVQALEQAVPAGPITDGTLLKRAPSDVGGLLDTTKGWTLNIPAPFDSDSAARVVAQQQRAAGGSQSAQIDAPPPSGVIASR